MTTVTTESEVKQISTQPGLLAPTDDFVRRHVGPSEDAIGEMLALLGLEVDAPQIQGVARRQVLIDGLRGEQGPVRIRGDERCDPLIDLDEINMRLNCVRLLSQAGRRPGGPGSVP